MQCPRGITEIRCLTSKCPMCWWQWGLVPRVKGQSLSAASMHSNKQHASIMTDPQRTANPSSMLPSRCPAMPVCCHNKYVSLMENDACNALLPLCTRSGSPQSHPKPLCDNMFNMMTLSTMHTACNKRNCATVQATHAFPLSVHDGNCAPPFLIPWQ